MRMLRSIIRTVDTISERLGKILSFLIFGMTAVLVYEVVVRYAFNAPTIWAHETSIFFWGYCGVLAGAYTLKHHAHINVDILYSRLSPRREAILDVVTGFLFLFIIALIIYEGWKMGMVALATHEHSPTPWSPPIAHFKLVLPVGATLLLVQGLANWVRSLYLAVTNKELSV